MEIKVQCRKDDKGAWHIEKLGEAFVRERRVVWTFEGLEPGIVPLLAFEDNPPHGPFPDAWLTASTFTGELREFLGEPAVHRYHIVLIQWNPATPAVVAEQSHELTIGARAPRLVEVFWRRGMKTIEIDPPVRDVGGASLVQWNFDIPQDVFATLEFASPELGKGLRPTGPFDELHGRRSDDVYRLTGQTDLVKDIYKYTVTLYDRTTEEVIVREDPKIDNNGVPIG